MINVIVLRPSQGQSIGQQQVAQPLQSIPDKIQEDELLWLDVESPTEKEIGELQRRFNLDSYAIEDVIHGKQRPKVEEYKDNTFSVIHLPVPARQQQQQRTKNDGGKGSKFGFAELFIFFGNRWVITIHKEDEEIIHDVDKRLRARGLAPLTTTPTSDLLYYVFLDFAVDAFYPMLDATEDEIETLEKQALVVFKTRKKRLENVDAIMSMMGGLREKLMTLRRTLSPTRDMLGLIMRGAVPFVADSSLRNFRDIYDHAFQLIETIDTYRDRTSDVRDLYMNLLAASTDNILKILTVVATILLPLSLLTSIYGMNFTAGFYEPGSGLWYGFYVLMTAMVAIALILTFMFRRAGWI